MDSNNCDLRQRGCVIFLPKPGMVSTQRDSDFEERPLALPFEHSSEMASSTAY